MLERQFAEIASNPRTDDSGFVSAIIDKAIAEDDVDPARVEEAWASFKGKRSGLLPCGSGLIVAAENQA